MRTWWLLCAVLVSCARREDPKIAPVHETNADASPPEELPVVRTKADIERFDHQRAVVLGTYDVEPVAPHHKKGGRMTTIVLADGTRIYRAYGLFKAELPFVNKRVRVTGIVTKGPPDPMLQAVGGPHVQPEKVELAEGETPTVPTPTALPTPPMVTTAAGFAPHVDRWVAVNGIVESFVRGAGAVWTDVVLRLSDGGTVVVKSVPFSEWAPLKGKAVTTIGRVHLEGTGAPMGMQVVLYGAGIACPGVEPRCGMNESDE